MISLFLSLRLPGLSALTHHCPGSRSCGPPAAHNDFIYIATRRCSSGDDIDAIAAYKPAIVFLQLIRELGQTSRRPAPRVGRLGWHPNPSRRRGLNHLPPFLAPPPEDAVDLRPEADSGGGGPSSPASHGWRGPNARGGVVDLEASAMASTTTAVVGPALGHGLLPAAAGLDRVATRCGLRRRVIGL